MAISLLNTTDYQLGRGKVLISLGTTTPTEWRDLGNAPEYNLQLPVETLEHFSSRAGAKVQDKEITLSQKVEATINLDDPNINNLALFFMDDAAAETIQASGTGATKNDLVAQLDQWVEIGTVDLSNVVVKDVTDVTTYAVGDDYELDLKAGLIRCLTGGSGGIADDDVLHLTFDNAAVNIHSVDAYQVSTQEAHIKFVGNPATGPIWVATGYASLTPEGDFGLISDDWTAFSLKLKYLEHADYTGLIKIEQIGTVD